MRYFAALFHLLGSSEGLILLVPKILKTISIFIMTRQGRGLFYKTFTSVSFYLLETGEEDGLKDIFLLQCNTTKDFKKKNLIDNFDINKSFRYCILYKSAVLSFTSLCFINSMYFIFEMISVSFSHSGGKVN